MSKSNFVLLSNCIFDGVNKALISGGIAVKDKVIQAIGSKSEIEKYITDETVLYDFEDKLIMPGFIDSHVHMICGMQTNLPCLDLLRTKSKEECLEKLKVFSEEHENLEFIYGLGWVLDDWDVKEWPTKEDLDAVCPDIPVFLSDADGWNCWINSIGLKTIGYTKETVGPEREKFIFKNEDGELKGITYGEGCEPTLYLAYYLSEKEQDAVATVMIDGMISKGITTVGELSAETTVNRDPEGYKIYKRLDRNGMLKLKMCLYPAIGKDTNLSRQNAIRDDINSNCEKISVNGLKMFMDGVINGYTAFMMEPYSDKPGERGDALNSQEDTNILVANANANGYPVRFHSLGDGAVNRVLNAIEYSQKEKGNPALPNAVEHINFVTEDDKKRFGKLGAIASMQPLHLIGYPDSCEPMFGEKRWMDSFPLKTLMDNGATVAISTDYPVVDYDPFYTIYSAIVRNDVEGTIKRFNEAEVPDIYEILEAYTYGGAVAMGIEDKTGSLEAGKLADIIVLDKKFVDAAPDEILSTEVEMTIVDGNIEYVRD